jgi:hypothetical protein
LEQTNTQPNENGKEEAEAVEELGNRNHTNTQD